LEFDTCWGFSIEFISETLRGKSSTLKGNPSPVDWKLSAQSAQIKINLICQEVQRT